VVVQLHKIGVVVVMKLSQFMFIIIIIIVCYVFSSPEHEVSFCDPSMSGVRPSVHASVNNFFKVVIHVEIPKAAPKKSICRFQKLEMILK